ncbi:MAG: sulfatase-like hydrolase/transferase [bacterium]|nr:sulfatase-like hydrolase/transferase [bacterium]
MIDNHVSRRAFLGTALMSAAASIQPHAATRMNPNVLLIMTDDQGWGDVHSHGNPLIDTPVMDRLAEQGARFDRFFVSPVCAPTRASLLSGRYYLRTGVTGVTRNRETMDSSETTLAEALRKEGYATGCFGKWHNGAHFPQHPNGQGFDQFIGFCTGHFNNYFDPVLERNGELVKQKGFISDVLTDYAIEFIETNQSQPFFCYVPYNAPHAPWQAPDAYFNKYKAKGLDDTTACAYAMCENLDDNIGRILTRLEELNFSKNTIVLFLTDNGPNSDRYNGGMRGRKGSVDEGGMRVPLFVRWPGVIEPGRVVHPIASHIDIYPTILDLCGIISNGSSVLDGENLSPVLRGDANELPDRKIFQYWAGRGAVRTQRWRAVHDAKGWRLHDMIADPGQREDVSDEYPEVLGELSMAYHAWFADVTARDLSPDPIDAGHPEHDEVHLPGHEAFLIHNEREEGISYMLKQGWANDWITNWTDREAYPYWDVNVVREGDYSVRLYYAAPKSCIGSEFRVEAGGDSIKGVIEEAHDPDHLPSPDRVPRTEVYEKVWKEISVGRLHLKEGRLNLSIKALKMTGDQMMEVKGISLKRL